VVIFRAICVTMAMLFTASLSSTQAAQPLNGPMRKYAMNGVCRFGMTDRFGGRLLNGDNGDVLVNQQQATYMAYIKKNGYKRPEHLVINVSCESESNFSHICRKMVGVEFKDGKWTPASPLESDGNRKPDPLNSILLSLDSGQNRGALYITSDTNGSIQFRLRILGFCLSNRNGATLWGDAVVESAPDDAKKSTESEAIKLIKSIEFESVSK